MEENNEILNNNEISRFSLLLNGTSYQKEKENLKNISKSDSDTNNIISNNNITSTSNIVEDININLTYSFVYIFNDILKILEKSDFIVNIKEDKIKIMYGDNQSKDFEYLVTFIEKYKKKNIPIV